MFIVVYYHNGQEVGYLNTKRTRGPARPIVTDIAKASRMSMTKALTAAAGYNGLHGDNGKRANIRPVIDPARVAVAPDFGPNMAEGCEGDDACGAAPGEPCRPGCAWGDDGSEPGAGYVDQAHDHA